MQFARIKGYMKAKDSGDILLIAVLTDTDGKPMLAEDDRNDIEIRFLAESLQKLIREELPSEEKRIQELLDKIHKIRTDRILSVQKIDEEIQKVMDDAKKDFVACQSKIDVSKTSALFRVRLAALGQKRLLSKFSIQEESELSLQLTKIKQGSS